MKATGRKEAIVSDSNNRSQMCDFKRKSFYKRITGDISRHKRIAGEMQKCPTRTVELVLQYALKTRSTVTTESKQKLDPVKAKDLLGLSNHRQQDFSDPKFENQNSCSGMFQGVHHQRHVVTRRFLSRRYQLPSIQTTNIFLFKSKINSKVRLTILRERRLHTYEYKM